ncbi:hypothetical protein [Haloactinopolyspora alba]|nr:hypothetical protein [Haloactinopolyspora alba]
MTAAASTSSPGAETQRRAAPAATGARSGVANPFSDIPIIDYARDAVALILLLVSFGMPWDLTDSSTGKVYVILATLLSVASLTVPYLKRGGILPATWGASQLRLTRLAANAPYFIVVLVTFVLAYVGDGGGDGVGIGIAFGLAGAVLAAQGRRSEQLPEPGDGALWRAVTAGLGGLFVLLTAISVVWYLVDADETLEWAPITMQILVGLFFLALIALPVAGFVRGQAGWGDVLLLLGGVGLFVGLWQLSAERTIVDAWSLQTGVHGVLLYPAIGAAASAAGVAKLVRPVVGAARWVTFSVRLFQLVALVSTFGAVMYVVWLIGFDDGRGSAITVLVLHLLIVVGALVGRNALVGDPAQGRAVAIGAGLVSAVVGIVIAAVLGASDLTSVTLVDATMVSVMWFSAVAVLLALTAPASVRDEYGPVAMNMNGLGMNGAGGGGTAIASAPAAPQAPTAPAAPTTTERSSESAAPASTAAAAAAAGTAASSDADTGRTGSAAGTERGMDEQVDVDGPSQDGTDRTEASTRPGETQSGEARSGETGEAESAAETEAAETGAETEAAETEVTGGAGSTSASSPDQTAVLPQAGASGEPEVVHEAGFDSRVAADPDTPLQTLADIAAQAPSLRPYVASNPSTYPELVEWLRQLGDPAVDAALQRRGR